MAVTNIYLTAGIRDNLFSLQKTEEAMQVTQQRLATGLKVNSALDDPISFFAAQAHRERAADLALLKDSMNEGIQSVKAANAGLEAITDLIAQAKSLITAARTSADWATLETQYDGVITQIQTLALDASYKGTNLLDGDTLTVDFSDNGSLDITGLDISGLTFTAADFDPANDAYDTLITELDGHLDSVRSAAQTLSSNLSIVTARLDFTQNMIDTLNTGADNLTLADMNEESANMLMLQTRQALGTSSLGMASDAAQAVLRLF
jgi:flagellin-like hook-associated protein FlgL